MRLKTTTVQAPSWAYSALLLILLMTIAVSGVFILDELRDMLGQPSDYPLVAGVFWLMTLGLMMIAGAFGLWTIRLTSRMQARRSVSEVLESLGVLEDGLFTIEANMEVRAWNAVFERYAACGGTTRPRLDLLFPSLNDEQRAAIAALTLKPGTGEVEANCVCPDGIERSLRFRSIGFGQVRLFQICDVTLMRCEQNRRRQAARLSLFADVSRGLRNDFSELLFVISGHAALLQRLEPGSDEAERSIKDIVKAAERCESLTDCFEALVSEPAGEAMPCSRPLNHIQAAAKDLQAMLPEGRSVAMVQRWESEPPPTALSGAQIERIVVNLGLCLAETAQDVKTLSVALYEDKPDMGSRVIMMFGTEDMTDGHEAFIRMELAREGLIPSVVNDILATAGGTLDCLRDSEGRAAFRIVLPPSEKAPAPTDPSDTSGVEPTR